MGRYPTIWDFKTGVRHRIPARISPWGSRGLNPNCFFRFFWIIKCPKVYFLGGFRIHPRPIAMDLGPRGPRGSKWRLNPPQNPSHKGPRGPRGPRRPKGPKGAQGGPRAPRIAPDPPGGSGGRSPPVFGWAWGGEAPRLGPLGPLGPRRHSRHRPYSTVRHASDYWTWSLY